jgi:hypothetical protein
MVRSGRTSRQATTTLIPISGGYAPLWYGKRPSRQVRQHPTSWLVPDVAVDLLIEPGGNAGSSPRKQRAGSLVELDGGMPVRPGSGCSPRWLAGSRLDAFLRGVMMMVGGG